MNEKTESPSKYGENDKLGTLIVLVFMIGIPATGIGFSLISNWFGPAQ